MDKVNPNASVNMSGEHMKNMLAYTVEQGVMSQEQSELIFWLFTYQKQNRLSYSALADQIGLNAGTISKLMRCTYHKDGAKYESICSTIANFRQLTTERQMAKAGVFVETEVARIIQDVCYSSLVTNSVSFVFGKTHVGKTMALEHYAAMNKGKGVHYVRLPASAGLQLTAKEIAEACYISRNGPFEMLRERILKALNRNSLLIIDELHQALISYQKQSSIKVFEFIREIHDRTGCGVVLCGTHVLRNEIERGRLSPMLEQFRERGIIWTDLPDTPKLSDLDLLAAGYGLPTLKSNASAKSWATKLVREHSIAHFAKYLQAGSSMAAKAEQEISWEHVLKAHDIIQRYSRK